MLLSGGTSAWPLLQLDPASEIKLVEHAPQASTICSQIIDALVSRPSHERYLAVDMEWPAGPRGGGPGRVALIQVSLPNDPTIFLFHLARFRSMPPGLQQLLEHADLTKVGINFGNDRAKLYKDWAVSMANCVDASHLAFERGLAKNRRSSLQDLLQAACQVSIPKPETLRCSDWSQALSLAQRNYAALDAFATRIAYEAIMSKPTIFEPGALTLASSALDQTVVLVSHGKPEPVARGRITKLPPAQVPAGFGATSSR